MNNWYVITGGPSTGKTSTLEIIKSMGYKTHPEIARIYIERELANGRMLEEIRKDEAQFQRKILELKIEFEKTLNPDDLNFLDRGIPDTIAYFRFLKMRDDSFSWQAIRQCSYKKIFLLSPLPYVKDHARIESKDESSAIHNELKRAYVELKFHVLEVPVLTPTQRAKFILNNLK
jgi:predicted ATPase